MPWDALRSTLPGDQPVNLDADANIILRRSMTSKKRSSAFPKYSSWVVMKMSSDRTYCRILSWPKGPTNWDGPLLDQRGNCKTSRRNRHGAFILRDLQPACAFQVLSLGERWEIFGGDHWLISIFQCKFVNCGTQNIFRWIVAFCC
jgi:hypothetical protein